MDTYVDTLILINKLSKITQGKGDVTRFLAQHSVAMLEQGCNIRHNVATRLQRCVALKIVFANRLV